MEYSFMPVEMYWMFVRGFIAEFHRSVTLNEWYQRYEHRRRAMKYRLFESTGNESFTQGIICSIMEGFSEDGDHSYVAYSAYATSEIDRQVARLWGRSNVLMQEECDRWNSMRNPPPFTQPVPSLPHLMEFLPPINPLF
jgi:hypothetical protein